MSNEQSATDGILVIVAIVLTLAAGYLLVTGQIVEGLYVLGVLTMLAVGAFGIEKHYD